MTLNLPPMMIELGQLLRQSREAKELSLAEVEAKTRIRQRYLAALEAGDWDELPNEVVARGFLHTYARFLGLDPNELLAQFGLAGSQPAAPANKTGQPVAAAAPAYRPIDFDLYGAQPQRRLLARRLFRLAILLILAVLLGFLLVRYGLPFLLEGRTPGQAATATATLPPEGSPPATPLIVLGASPTPTAAAATATPTAAQMRPATTAAASPSPTATATPIQQIHLLIEVTQRAWIRLTADEQVLLEGIREAGFRQEFSAQESMILRTGNAGGLQLTLNGETLPSLGGPGEIVELKWVLEDGVITQPSPTPTLPAPTATATPQP